MKYFDSLGSWRRQAGGEWIGSSIDRALRNLEPQAARRDRNQLSEMRVQGSYLPNIDDSFNNGGGRCSS